MYTSLPSVGMGPVRCYVVVSRVQWDRAGGFHRQYVVSLIIINIVMFHNLHKLVLLSIVYYSRLKKLFVAIMY